MKKLTYFIGGALVALSVAAWVVVTFFTNPYTPTYTEAESGLTLKLKVGQEFSVRLRDPGDGGYDFDPLQFSQNVLGIAAYQDLGPIYWGGGEDSPMAYRDGDFGTKIWTFTAENAGETDLIFSISRSWEEDSSEVKFEAHVIVEK